MNRKKIIEDLKNNERAYMFLSEEEKEVLSNVHKQTNITFLFHKSFVQSDSDSYCDGVVYRIKSDYSEPEPKTIEFKVFEDKISNMFVYKYKDEGIYTLTSALNNPSFIGYKYEELSYLTLYPRRIDKINSSNEVLYPTHVVFSTH